MSEEMKQGSRGRPHRKSAPFVIRGTVPDGHPLYERLRILGSARAAMFLLELATNRLDGFVTGQVFDKQNHQPASNGANVDNLLNLNSKATEGNLNQSSTTEVIPLGDVSDLLNFSGS